MPSLEFQRLLCGWNISTLTGIKEQLYTCSYTQHGVRSNTTQDIKPCRLMFIFKSWSSVIFTIASQEFKQCRTEFREWQKTPCSWDEVRGERSNWFKLTIGLHAVAQISTLYNHDEQKSISKTHKTLDFGLQQHKTNEKNLKQWFIWRAGFILGFIVFI